MPAVSFRCEQCGKLLSVDAQSGSSVKCPHCRKVVTVPQGLASLPRPKVPPNVVEEPEPISPDLAAVQQASRMAPPQQLQAEVVGETAELSGTLASLMPWVMSLFLHLGIVLIAVFSTMFVVKMTSNPVVDVTIPGETFSDNPGGVINPGGGGGAHAEARTAARSSEVASYSGHQASLATGGSGGGSKGMSLIGVSGGAGGGGGGMGSFLGGGGGSGREGPPSTFFGSGGNAHHVVYVIDRSGSMATNNVFEAVCQQIRISIGKLAEVQDFHVIFFSSGAALEPPHRRLVDATDAYKMEAVGWMERVVAEGQTDPIPALKRAFDVLDNADTGRKGKQIFLLTDGAFKDNEEVLNFLRKRNKPKKKQDDIIHINTYIYGADPRPEAVDVMKTIAKEHGGIYKAVGNDD